jgi:A/G-specific adenine glycosylase
LGLHTPIDAPHAAKYYQNIAQNLLNTHLPAAHNQAIMELGALCCTPAQPQCPQCPLVTHCAAYKAQEMDILPIKQKKMVKKNRYFNYIVLRNDDGIYLKKRTTNDVWQDLHDFFLIESPENLLSQKNIEQHLNHSFEVQNIDYKLVSYSKIYKQTLTHQHIWALFWVFDIFFDVKGAHNLELCNLHAVNLLPVSRLVELFLTENITLIKAT